MGPGRGCGIARATPRRGAGGDRWSTGVGRSAPAGRLPTKGPGWPGGSWPEGKRIGAHWATSVKQGGNARVRARVAVSWQVNNGEGRPRNQFSGREGGRSTGERCLPSDGEGKDRWHHRSARLFQTMWHRPRRSRKDCGGEQQIPSGPEPESAPWNRPDMHAVERLWGMAEHFPCKPGWVHIGRLFCLSV
jgi:hypothetical protein